MKAGRRPGEAPLGANLLRLVLLGANLPRVVPLGAILLRAVPPGRPTRVASASRNFRRHAKSDDAARPRSMQNRCTESPLRSCSLCDLGVLGGEMPWLRGKDLLAHASGSSWRTNRACF